MAVPMTTVKIAKIDRDTVQELAKKSGRTHGDIVHEALKLYCRQLFLSGMNRGFEALRKEPRAWQMEMGERIAWDVTLRDFADEE